MITNHSASILKPSSTTPKTYASQCVVDCWFVQVSNSQLIRGNFVGMDYTHELTTTLPVLVLAEITEGWRVAINGINYTVENIRHVETNSGYRHSILGLKKYVQ